MSASDHPPATRRDFLQLTAGLAAAAAVLTPAAAADGKPATQPTLPTIKLGSHDVTRLILGGNPIYGHSHFNRLFSQHLTDYHTPERVQQLLKRAEQAGINTWQNSYAERTLQDLDRYRDNGGKMNWLCLGKGDWDQKPERIDEAAKRKPIGIAPHGALLKRIRDKGVLVGLSAHNPALVELAEEKGWPVDYYMTCLYYLTRPKEEQQKLLGKDLPLGEIYLPSDPARMFKAIKATKKPCLAYKILAAGRRIGSAAEIRAAFQTAFENIKPTDAIIVGMYLQFGDQVTENAALVRELGQKKD
jgi:hypothetical protein